MLLLASGISYLNAAAVLAIIGAICTAFVTVRKVGPEKNAIYITSAQGAAVIMDNLIETLREEVDRERERNSVLTAEITKLTKENERLQTAHKALTQRSGDRYDD